MNTFSEMWGVRTPQEAMDKINEQRQEMAGKEPQNLEEQAISLIGRDIYEKLIKGYTEKQWGRKATELPAFIIKRLPVRLTYDNNYFNEFFDYKLGELEYRSLRFETEEKDVDNYQGNAVINYTDAETPYTRVIEHKHFEFGKGDKDKTIITREYPADWKRGDEPYYPVNNERNNTLYKQYRDLSEKENDKVIFGGRLGQYKYYNMDQVIAAALESVKNEFGE